MDCIKNIIDKHPKHSGGPAYEEQRLERIDMVLKMANVNMKDYLEALATSKVGYSIVLARDIDEIYINFELLHDICINFLHYNDFYTTLNTS